MSGANPTWPAGSAFYITPSRCADHEVAALCRKFLYILKSGQEKKTAPMRVKQAIVILCLFWTPAFGKDLDTLIRILSPAFLGQQGVSICTDMPLEAETQSTFSRLNAYANYIKVRVTDGLTESEAQYVLKSSVDNAKVQMDEVVRLLKLDPDQEYPKRLRWCRENLMNIAQKVLSTYAFDKHALENMVDDAKRETKQ